MNNLEYTNKLSQFNDACTSVRWEIYEMSHNVGICFVGHENNMYNGIGKAFGILDADIEDKYAICYCGQCDCYDEKLIE
jgi:hypothetical protein